jgi:hypothetical protein
LYCAAAALAFVVQLECLEHWAALRQSDWGSANYIAIRYAVESLTALLFMRAQHLQEHLI